MGSLPSQGRHDHPDTILQCYDSTAIVISVSSQLVVWTQPLKVVVLPTIGMWHSGSGMLQKSSNVITWSSGESVVVGRDFVRYN